MIRALLRLIILLLFGKPRHPQIPNLRPSADDGLYFDSLTRGLAVIGKPGAGKTVWAAMQTLDYALAHPDHPVFLLDASGSFTDELIKLVYQLPPGEREKVEERLVYDRMGDPSWTVPMPFFSPAYGLNYEEQVQRVVGNFQKISEHLVTNAPVLGGLAFSETAPELFRLLCAITDDDGHNWQITEAKKLLLNADWLTVACKKFGRKVPEAKFYFEREFLNEDVSRRERELRTFTLRAVLGTIEPRPIRARVGYHTPGWTPKEAVEKGQIVLVSGEELINQEAAQAVLFTDAFSQILAHINKRVPHNPDDVPVLLVIDEVPMLLGIRGMAEEISKVAPQYRSRKLMLAVIFQALWQLADVLRDSIWSFGNRAIFSVEDLNEAYEIAQQNLQYDPTSIKLPPASGHGHPIVEPDRGQFLAAANWIQHLQRRELLLRLYVSEGEEEKFVRYVEQTRERPATPLEEPLLQIKERLLKRRAVPVQDALRVVNGRKLRKAPSQPKGPPTI